MILEGLNVLYFPFRVVSPIRLIYGPKLEGNRLFQLPFLALTQLHRRVPLRLEARNPAILFTQFVDHLIDLF
jgi:hypothetical protein